MANSRDQDPESREPEERSEPRRWELRPDILEALRRLAPSTDLEAQLARFLEDPPEEDDWCD